jgi:hypothetical protein
MVRMLPTCCLEHAPEPKESEATMLTGSTATAPVRERAHAKTIRRKQSAELLEHLRLIARQHEVCYEIWPLWSTSQGARTQKGFELLLCGVNGHMSHESGVLHAVSCCHHCAHTYSELREIAEWVLHMRRPPAGYEIYSFDRALHLAPPHRNHRSEIVITTAIFHSSNHKTGSHHCESECLKEVRARLSKLGIRDDTLFTQPPGNA